MLATLAIEIILAIHTMWRYKLNPITRIVVALLVCLALFQWAEYNVCEGTVLFDSVGWAKLGYVAITMLPPLGIHLVYQISADKRRWIPVLGYTLAVVFISYFLLAVNGVSAGVCLGNYVIFENQPGISEWYGLYYYGLLFVAIAYAYTRGKNAKKTHSPLIVVIDHRLRAVHCANDICQYHRSINYHRHPVDYVRLCSTDGSSARRKSIARIHKAKIVLVFL